MPNLGQEDIDSFPMKKYTYDKLVNPQGCYLKSFCNSLLDDDTCKIWYP